MTNLTYRLGSKLILSLVVLLPPISFVSADTGVFNEIESNISSKDFPRIESMIVTATRESSQLLRTPVSVAAFEMEDEYAGRFQNLTNVADQVAGVSIANSGNAAFPVIFVRGVGSTDTSMATEPTVGFYVDDVYVGRAAGVITDLFDIERVEVIKGPQGSTWGRNTLGGAIHVVTRNPRDSDMNELFLGVGNFSDVRIGGLVSKQLSENLYGKLSFNRNKRDGFTRNELGGPALGDADSYAIRSSLGYRQSESSEWVFSADYTKDRSLSAGFDPLIVGRPFFGGLLGNVGIADPPFSYSEPQDEYVVNHPEGSREHRDLYGVSGKYTLDLPALRFLSVTSIRGIKFDNSENTDGLPFQLVELVQQTDQTQFSQEFRLSGDLPKTRWMMGLYYFREETDDEISLNSQDFNFLLAGDFGIQDYSSTNNSKTVSTSYSIYGNLSYDYTSNLRADFGLRATRETKDFRFGRVSNDIFEILLDPSVPVSTSDDSWSDLSPSLKLSYLPSLGRSIYYGSISHGFRAGGYNTLQTTEQNSFDSESLIAYELGMKSMFVKDRLMLDASLFHYDHTDIQVQTLTAQSAGSPIVVTSNAAKATEQGIDLSVMALPTELSKFDATFSYLDATYDRFVNVQGIDVSGNRVKFSSKYSATFGVEYEPELRGDVQFRVRAEYSLKSKVYFTETNLPELMQDSYDLVNAYLEMSSERLNAEATIYIKNLTNEAAIGSATDFLDILGTVTRNFQPPRTFGVNLKLRY